jgi:ABC-2 type transport system ATP-binding protein
VVSPIGLNMTATLRVMNLTKNFADLRAVDNISFAAVAGEVVGLLGPNGAGKSTTMKMIAGFLRPSSGTAYINGYDVLEEPIAAKTHLGYLPEGMPCYSDMTVRSFIKFVSQLRKVTPEVFDVFNLRSVLDKRIGDLSKGYKKRVGLAQALIHDPSLLILDEPTDGLDPIQKREVRGLIKQSARNKVILLSTHLLEEVAEICDRVIVIAAGRVMLDGAPQISKIEQVFSEIELSTNV